VLCFLGTKERVAPPAQQEADLGRELRDLVGNVPWVVMCLVGVVTLTAFITRSQSTAYFFKYYVRDESLTKIAITTGMIAGILGIALVPPLTRLLGGKRNLFAALMAISGALTVAFYFLPATSPRLLIAFNILIVLIQGGNSPLVWAMYADTADYAEWKNGRRNTGLIFSAATMSQKGGGALAGVLNGIFLTVFGYVANAEQTARSLLGIRLTMSVIPGLLCIVAASIIVFYKLDDRTMKSIERALLERRASDPAGAKNAV
jgi:GPH family glycoside/pentoside/hexuronide:cation symporter